MTDSDKVYLPLDFNSLSNLREGSLKLTDYYINYACSGSEVEPRDGHGAKEGYDFIDFVREVIGQHLATV